MNSNGLPPKQGLYDPQFEHDACGVGFIVHMKGEKVTRDRRSGVDYVGQS